LDNGWISQRTNRQFKALVTVMLDWRLTLSLITGVVMIALHPALAVIGFNLVFNAFDLLGYRNVLQSDLYSILNEAGGAELPSYRIMQFLFQAALLAVIYFMFGWTITLCAELLHWCGFQDLLYYKVGGYKMPGTWTWLTWTPLGIIKGNVTDSELKWQIAAGFLVCAVIYLTL